MGPLVPYFFQCYFVLIFRTVMMVKFRWEKWNEGGEIVRSEAKMCAMEVDHQPPIQCMILGCFTALAILFYLWSSFSQVSICFQIGKLGSRTIREDA